MKRYIFLFFFFAFFVTSPLIQAGNDDVKLAKIQLVSEIKAVFEKYQNEALGARAYEIALNDIRHEIRGALLLLEKEIGFGGLFVIDLLTSHDLRKGQNCQSYLRWLASPNAVFLTSSLDIVKQNKFGREQLALGLIKNFMGELDSYLNRTKKERFALDKAISELDKLLEGDVINVDDVAKLIEELEEKEK